MTDSGSDKNPVSEEQTLAAESLYMDQARSHKILSSIRQGVIFMDEAFRVRQVNEEAQRIDGRSASEMLGRTHWELWPGTEHLPVGKAYKRSMEERSIESLEQCYRHHGKDIWFDIQSFPVDEGIVVFYRDISERKQAETALSEREQQLALAIDAADVGEWDVDMISGAMFWPARVKAMFGISPDRPVTLADYYEGVHPEDRERTFNSFQNTADPQLRSQYDAEYRTIGKEDGLIRWVAAKGRGLFNEAGECIRIIGTAIDITKRKASEEALRQSEERLREIDRRKDEFLAMLAHELRNPLAPIRAAADLLQIADLDEQRVRQTSQIIGRQVEHMTGLVDDLLDVSRVTTGQVKIERSPLDINHIINEAIEQVSPVMRVRRHQLALQMMPESTMVVGDRKRLVQVLANILNNAAKYTNEGGRIEVNSTAVGAEVLVEVIDDGIGMSPDVIARAFELFAQAERTSDRSSGGLGLGLALVKSIIELHGGSVSCSSPGTGKGSTFMIRLPRMDEAGTDASADGEEAANPDFERPPRILLVDDNEDAASMLSLLLRSVGYDVSVEYDAKRALEQSALHHFDVFLLDIGLPEISGIELARRLRAQAETADAAIIAVTGYGQDQDRAQTSAAGFDHHLVKPIDFRKLAALLGRIISARP
ncbi:ATP-binding protein [Allohahella sp. A8]|uniref:PAS domain-containing hybrid sensor histidine kinase/response regulator n=1 Tax=Allohahella sp. A8 TaxID=3141461 RepID=UPI003A7F97DD